MPASLRVGIAGTGGVALASAAWLASQGHAVALWSPGGHGATALRSTPLRAHGVVEAELPIPVADSAQALAEGADVLLVAAPANSHRDIAEALLPHLRATHRVIVSSMASLSSLYLFEAARARNGELLMASFGTTVFTARRTGDAEVRVLTRRGSLGVSALPTARLPEALELCTALFGPGFFAHANVLATALSNVNPISHGPLALMNWTRIERAEPWPQYHYLTPRVAAVIEQLDAERLALARAFGLELPSLQQHFARSFGTQAETLAAIAEELHAKRGGPPGPTSLATRFLTEDMPYGLAFATALGRLASVPMPATQAVLEMASLAAGRDFARENGLIEPLRLGRETVQGLLARVGAQR